VGTHQIEEENGNEVGRDRSKRAMEVLGCWSGGDGAVVFYDEDAAVS
jgi:hypothetical protein